MDVQNSAGIELTESYAMWPGASVSGLYFAHPDSHYFGVGKVERDQVAVYARIKNRRVHRSAAPMVIWLAPVSWKAPRLVGSLERLVRVYCFRRSSQWSSSDHSEHDRYYETK